MWQQVSVLLMGHGTDGYLLGMFRILNAYTVIFKFQISNRLNTSHLSLQEPAGQSSVLFEGFSMSLLWFCLYVDLDRVI